MLQKVSGSESLPLSPPAECKALAPWCDEHLRLAGFYSSTVNRVHQLFGWAGRPSRSTTVHSCRRQCCVQLFAPFFQHKSGTEKKTLWGKERVNAAREATALPVHLHFPQEGKQPSALLLFLGPCILQNPAHLSPFLVRPWAPAPVQCCTLLCLPASILSI